MFWHSKNIWVLSWTSGQERTAKQPPVIKIIMLLHILHYINFCKLIYLFIQCFNLIFLLNIYCFLNHRLSLRELKDNQISRNVLWSKRYLQIFYKKIQFLCDFCKWKLCHAYALCARSQTGQFSKLKHKQHLYTDVVYAIMLV